jgi:hypothetical protein
MKAKLPNGMNVQVGVRHTTDELPNHEHPGESIVCRSTHVLLTLEDGVDFAARAICKPPDQFCKRDGRRRAADRLLQNLKFILPSKEDRRAVFQMVCPEYSQNSPRRERRKLRRRNWYLRSLQKASPEEK